MNKIGLAFPDYIKKEKDIRRSHFNGLPGDRSFRNIYMLIFIFFFFGILLIRLINLQIFNGSYYRKLSDTNRIRTSIIHAPRGTIFDRNSIPLVFNVPGFREKIGNKAVQLTRDEALVLIASGKNLEIDSLRQYPYKEAFAQVLGYTGQISEDEIKKNEFADYHIDDFIGKTGIEKEYESLLHGINGKQLVEVDTTGKTVRTLGQTDPVSGRDIKLTLDSKLQIAAYDAMKNVKKGAVIVSNPKGEILAMISKPSFDPNLFTMGKQYVASGEYKNVSDVLLDSDGQPLINRAIAGVYPPGSTFKIINAAAGLEDKKIDANFQIEDTGRLTIGSFSFANWYFTQYGKTDGMVNVVKALQRSNDIFFYKSAEMVGVDNLSKMASKFGLGEKTGIDLGGEATGTVPTESWKEKVIGEQWYLGDTYHYGIGQGYLLATPIQINLMTQIIANKGEGYRPHLLKGSELKIQNPEFLHSETVDLIRKGMEEACSEGGVAWPFFDFKVKNSKLKIDGKNFLDSDSSGSAKMTKVSIACKTGTAEHGDEKTLPHAWITLFAPAENPQIIVTALVESSGEGSNVAAPVAKKVLESYFGNM